MARAWPPTRCVTGLVALAGFAAMGALVMPDDAPLHDVFCLVPAEGDWAAPVVRRRRGRSTPGRRTHGTAPATAALVLARHYLELLWVKERGTSAGKSRCGSTTAPTGERTSASRSASACEPASQGPRRRTTGRTRVCRSGSGCTGTTNGRRSGRWSSSSRSTRAGRCPAVRRTPPARAPGRAPRGAAHRPGRPGPAAVRRAARRTPRPDRTASRSSSAPAVRSPSPRSWRSRPDGGVGSADAGTGRGQAVRGELLL